MSQISLLAQEPLELLLKIKKAQSLIENILITRITKATQVIFFLTLESPFFTPKYYCSTPFLTLSYRTTIVYSFQSLLLDSRWYINYS